MRFWQLIAGIVIFKAFDGCFALAEMADIKAPIMVVVVAIAMWTVVSILVWGLANSLDGEIRARRG